MNGAKLGGWSIRYSPKPPRVPDIELYWTSPPPERSARCEYWLRHIEQGFRPNRLLECEDYYTTAEWFGVYLWEYFHVLWPLIYPQHAERKGN